MDLFLPKFFVQTLRERAKRKFGCRKRRRGRVAAQRSGCACEEERASLPMLVEGLTLKRGDRLTRKRKRGLDVGVRRSVQFLLRDLQERLPDAKASVEERHAYVRVWPMRAHSAECGLHFFVVVVGYRERCGLQKHTKSV
jgi:hypothetical protein